MQNFLKYKISLKNNFKKKSAVPEYIWYISLIVISITLVFGVISLLNRANKESVKDIPKIRDVSFVMIINPLQELKVKELKLTGVQKDQLSELYFFCEDVYFRFGDEYDPNVYFSKDAYNYYFLNREIIINYTKYNYSAKCIQENAKWMLFYGEPGNGGVMLEETKVIFSSDLG